MLARTLLLALTSAVSLVTAQDTRTIDPNSVPLSTRDNWCDSQKSACPLLCLQLPGATEVPESNTCNPKTLEYSCVCSNGQSPNASEYTQTIPYFICTEANNQCVANCGNVNSCQAACRQDHPCGAQDPKRYNITTTASTMTATASASATSGGDVIYTGFGTAATGKPGKGSAARALALEIGQVYGLAAVVAGFVAGFAVLL
ncbi:hypothetical protein M432DRAFT_85050 [Thermoascus aurantiacus ATCC 26904]